MEGKENDIVIDFLSNAEVFASLFNGYLFAGEQVFDILRYVNDGRAMLSFVNEHRNEYSQLDEVARRFLVLLTDMDFYSEKEDMEEVSDVCKALEDIKNMGREEVLSSLVNTMFKKGKSYEEISSLTDISIEKVKEIVED